MTEHPFLGPLELIADVAPDGSAPELLFCDNETNDERIFGTPGPAYPKDGINDHVVDGADSVNPDAARNEGGVPVPRRGRSGRDRRAAAAAAARGQHGVAVGGLRRGRRDTRARRPTSSTPS